MKPSLQFRLSQHLTLTPQLQQSIRLLQLSTVELNQEIERILMENPALEREDGEEHGGGSNEQDGAPRRSDGAAPGTRRHRAGGRPAPRERARARFQHAGLGSAVAPGARLAERSRRQLAR